MALGNGDQPPVTSPPPRRQRSFYAARIADFLPASPEAIVGQLSSRQVAFFAAAEAEQVRAWEREIKLLKRAFTELGSACSGWWLLLEVPLLRLGKRLDAVILMPGVVVVVEFKIGAATYDAQARVQAESYAASLHDFHEVSRDRLIVPILCAERAGRVVQEIRVEDGVSDLLLSGASSLGQALGLAAQRMSTATPQIDAETFDFSPYRPTPTIIEAARALYAGHQITDIGRGDAADEQLQAAAERLRSIALAAEASSEKVICFVTGAPGAGKTLLGLDLALKIRSGAQPAALLSGNRPLVHVLTEALAADFSQREKVPLEQARYRVKSAIQNLLGYLKEHTDGATPPEPVIVYDEAQRAWDAEVGQQLMDRPSSEPELFLEILDRLRWACLVCLVGPGQEINRGEGGLQLWGAALAEAAAKGRRWRVIAAPQALVGGPDVAGPGLMDGGMAELRIDREPQLHLANAVRSYRNPLHGLWVAKLLEGDMVVSRGVV